MTPFSARISILQRQLQALLEKLQLWCKSHAEKIFRTDVRVRLCDDIVFVVMQKDILYDTELSGLLSDLDIEIFNDPDFESIRLNVMGISRCSFEAAQAFIDQERNICIAEFSDAKS